MKRRGFLKALGLGVAGAMLTANLALGQRAAAEVKLTNNQTTHWIQNVTYRFERIQFWGRTDLRQPWTPGNTDFDAAMEQCVQERLG